MRKFNLCFFGEIDLDNLEDYYDAEIRFSDKEVELDLNFGIQKIEISELDHIKSVLNNLQDFDEKNRVFIKNDFENSSNGSMVYDYLNFHLEELEDEFTEFFDEKDDANARLKKLINILTLKRVGFYPDEDEKTVIFDYCLNDEVSDELLVIVMKNQKELSVTWES